MSLPTTAIRSRSSLGVRHQLGTALQQSTDGVGVGLAHGPETLSD